MPRTRSLAWSELKIGILTIAAIVVTALLIVSLTGAKGFSWQRYSLKARFGNVAGLVPGSPVRVSGVQVGTVKSLSFAGEQVDVTFDVNKDQRDRITTASTARLGSVSLLGASAIDIAAATRGTPIPDWGYVPQGQAAAQFSDITDQASRGIDDISKLIGDVRAGRGTVGKLMTDERLYLELNQFVATAGQLAHGIREGRGSVGKLLNDPKAAEALEASLKNIESMTAQINAGRGSLGTLLKDDAFAASLGAATANLRDVTGRLNKGEGTAGKLMTDASLFNRLNSVANRFDELTTKLNEGEGTAGQLLKDKQLYENMNKAVSQLQSLLAAIQKDPKKYLNVKVSIF